MTTVYRHDGHRNGVTDADALTDFAAEDQHGADATGANVRVAAAQATCWRNG